MKQVPPIDNDIAGRDVPNLGRNHSGPIPANGRLPTGTIDGDLGKDTRTRRERSEQAKEAMAQLSRLQRVELEKAAAKILRHASTR